MPNIVSHIVEVCVFRVTGGLPEYLILKRALDDKIYPGIWQIVTGVLEEGETATAAALRELKEETGLSPAKFWRLPVVHSFYDAVHDVVHLCPGFVARVAGQIDPRLSSEHAAFEWCTLDRALILLPWTGQRDSLALVHDRFVRESNESRLLEISHS